MSVIKTFGTPEPVSRVIPPSAQEIGRTFRSVLTIGSEFSIKLLGTIKVGERIAVLLFVSGRAWIFGFQQIGLDPTDPFPRGFSLSDC